MTRAVSEIFKQGFSQLNDDIATQMMKLSLEESQVMDLSSMTQEQLDMFIKFAECKFSAETDWQPFLDTLTKFSQFRHLKTCVQSHFPTAFNEAFDAVFTHVNKKFKILVLVDIGGTIFFRSSDKEVKGSKFDFKHKRCMYFYRPGHRHFIKTSYEHPRITFGFYSSIMLSNIEPVMREVLTGDLAPVLKLFTVFDQ